MPTHDFYRLLLYAEDNDAGLATQGLLKRVPEAQYHVVCMHHADTVLKSMMSNEHDIYILELGADVRAGIGLLQRAVIGGCGSPIVVLVDQENRDDDRAVLAAGADAYLVKGGTDPVILERTLRFAVVKSRERRALDEHARTLARVNSELQHFAYALTHDLRAPLQVVSGRLELLQQSLGSRLRSQEQEHLGQVFSTVERMALLIENLLSYARFGRREAHRADVELGEVMEEVQRDLEGLFSDVDAQFEIGPLPTLYADRRQFEQLFRNLVENAVKYRSELAPMIEVSASRQHSGWLLSVRDNGRGFDPSSAGSIFEMFRRLDDDEVPGSGLGLATCKRIVESHGGRIWAEGFPGKGACIYMQFPD